MIELTDRQTQILKAIVEEYIETAKPVGSDTLEKKYNLDVSPATIRNEMVALTKMGLLKQPHTSSGRSPSTSALKFYINQLMEEKELGVADEVTVKEKIWDYRDQLDRLFHEITQALADKTRSLALMLTDEGSLYHAGYANILDMPEFFDIDATKSVLSLIEDFEQLHRFFSQASAGEIVHTLMGDDFGFEPLESCSLVFTNFDIKGKVKGSLGVIGPCRLNYPLVVPTIKYFGSLLEEVLSSV
jgi:transcriptional regulator of heat shock response